MAKSKAEIRREKLRARQTSAIKNRDKKGLGKKSVLDWSKFPGAKPENFTIKIKEMHLFDILPFKITQEWYKNLRTKQGNTTGLDVGEWDYKLELPVHKGVGPDNDVFICLREAFGKKCPICEDMFEEYAKEKPDKEKARQLNCSWRDYFNVFDYNGEDDELMVWEDASYALFEKEFLEEAEEGEEIVLYTDTEEGKSIEFKTKEDSIGTNKFPIVNLKTLKFVERDPYDDSIVDETISFDSLLNIPTYDDVFKAHNATEEEEENTEPEKEKEEPKNRSRGRNRVKKETPKEEKKPEKDSDNPCPMGRNFGYDCDPGADDCEKCPDDSFNDCSDLKEQIDQGNYEDKQSEPEKEEPKEKNELERDVAKEKNETAPTRRRARKTVKGEKTEKSADTGKVTRRRRR